MLRFLKNIIIHILNKSIEFIEKIEYRSYNLDEDDVNKKILNSLSISNIKVLTDTGYHPISHIHITQPYTHYEIVTQNFKMECADNHIIFDNGNYPIFTKDVLVGSRIQTINGPEIVVSIKRKNRKSSMFDITVDHEDHRFYTNGILSHNTVCSSITILHYALFNNNKNILVTANKLDTSIEILDKIREVYQRLPFFLQQGIINWNQKFITFENKSRIKGFATTKTSSIGQAADFLYLDEFAHIPENIADKFYKSVFPTVSNIDNSRIIITSTPNGFNLFHKLLTDAEKPEGEKSSYVAKRVYWWQVPKRFVTYIRLNSQKMKSFEVKKEEILNYLSNKYILNKIEMRFDHEIKKWVIYVYNNDDCREEDILIEEYKGMKILEFSEITTWKKEAIKNIGGEDAFNQEYGLKFITSSRNLLSEGIVEDLNNQKRSYEWMDIPEFEKLKFSYKDLVWINDSEIYNPLHRKKVKVIISVDLSEGLGQDYSVINIFKLGIKDLDIIERQKSKFKSIVDFSKLEQIGMYRSNVISVKDISELLYILCFEYFDPDNIKVVLEINTYGNELLAHLPNVFDGKNNYGSYIFMRYKHRQDSLEEKIGIKIGDNKNLLVKEYQERMESKSIQINNESNISEIITFIKHVTHAGNIRYAADGSSNDDIVMTVVSLSSIFGKIQFSQMVEEYIDALHDEEIKKYINDFISGEEYIEPINYSQILNIRKKKMNSKSDINEKSIGDWIARFKS